MDASRETLTDHVGLLRLAAAGDADAFSEVTRAYRAELHAHCYSMLGSVHDAEDAFQEAMLRAWRGMHRFQGRGTVRSWLYSIATNTALDIASHRSRRELPVDFGPQANSGAGLEAPLTDLAWLEPYPDRWLADSPDLTPEAHYDIRESLELAFIIVLQHLPPQQRAVLLLREVVGFSAAETAAHLNTSAFAVNSALQRARATVRDRLPASTQQSALRLLGDQRAKAVVQRYADAIEESDVGALISLLTDDATWSMPPHPTWFRGQPAITAFLTRYPLTQRWKHRPTAASGQLAVGGYRFDPGTDRYVPAVIDVLTLRDEKISAVTAFLTAEMLELPHSGTWPSGAETFSRFGLPAELPVSS